MRIASRLDRKMRPEKMRRRFSREMHLMELSCVGIWTKKDKHRNGRGLFNFRISAWD
jgi:hypothetical protein